MLRLTKFDIQIAISAILIKKRNRFFCKNIYHNAVNHVQNFQLSARSSSFFGAVFPSLLWSNFFWDTQYLAERAVDKGYILARDGFFQNCAGFLLRRHIVFCDVIAFELSTLYYLYTVMGFPIEFFAYFIRLLSI